MKAIETSYAGRRFRSRLEARWAVFFDRAGIDWQYEPEGYDNKKGFRYLPDFYLPKVEEGVFFEVKGDEPTSEYLVRVTLLLPKAVVFAVGDVPGKTSLWSEDKAGSIWHFDGFLFDGGSRHCDAVFLDGSSSDYKEEYLFPDAVRAARSARFEHGEAP